MSLGFVIARFRTGTYTCTRYTDGTYTLGRHAAGSSSTFTIEASVQPLTSKQLLTLAEGQRTEQLRTLYTTTQLYSRESGFAADTVTIDSVPWVVLRVDKWDGLYPNSPHFECLIARQS